MKLRARDQVVQLDTMVVMGVLNVTPDSFSDGGMWTDPSAALDHAGEMAEAGAAIIDVGGESTRPGAEPVPTHEELARVLPVIERLCDEARVLVSIDTRKVEVAKEALAAGADIINDTSGEVEDPRMAELAAAEGAGIIAMHSRGTPKNMRDLAVYEDVVEDVRTWLLHKVDRLAAAGVGRDTIALDPGYGFAKTPQQNLALLKRIDEIVSLGLPVVVGTSRKSFIGLTLQTKEKRRLEGTIATVLWARERGAAIARVHDVEPVQRALKMYDAIAKAHA